MVALSCTELTGTIFPIKYLSSAPLDLRAYLLHHRSRWLSPTSCPAHVGKVTVVRIHFPANQCINGSNYMAGIH